MFKGGVHFPPDKPLLNGKVLRKPITLFTDTPWITGPCKILQRLLNLKFSMECLPLSQKIRKFPLGAIFSLMKQNEGSFYFIFYVSPVSSTLENQPRGLCWRHKHYDERHFKCWSTVYHYFDFVWLMVSSPGFYAQDNCQWYVSLTLQNARAIFM